MVDGNALWGNEITGDMITVKEFGNEVSTFPCLSSNLFEAMKKTALTYPEKTALVSDEGERCSYSRFLEKTEEFAAYLHGQKGVDAGKRVGLMMHNTIEYCVAFYALSRIGAVMVSLPGKFRQMEVLALAERADMELLICDEEYADWFADICSPEKIVQAENGGGYGYARLLKTWKTRAADEARLTVLTSGTAQMDAIMMFTSGTTSQSKAVLLKNRQIMHAVEVYRRTLGITEKDISVIATPIYHITGLVAVMGLFLSTGGTLYLHRRFEAKRLLADARTYGFTFLHASPTVFHLLLEEGEQRVKLPALRSLACGSSNMPKEKIRRLHRWLPGVSFHTVYGLTETSSPAAIFPGDAAKSPYIGASGLPVPGVCFKITDEEYRELPVGEVGEIAVRGSCVTEHYYGKHGGSLRDGWLYTGDLGYFNEQRYLYVVDRKKDLINRGGEKIWCYDVENEMESIPGIRSAAVVGIADRIYGEAAAAVVELETGRSLTAQEIREYLKPRMAGYKIPVKIMAVEKIPQTANGKPDKKAIKKMMAEA